SAAGLDTDRLADMNKQIGEVGPLAWQLSLLLGEPGTDPEADERVSRIERGLTTLRAWITEYQNQVRQVRQRVTEGKTRAGRWVTPAAVLISFASFWLALSQLCIMSRAWSWFTRPGGRQPGRE